LAAQKSGQGGDATVTQNRRFLAEHGRENLQVIPLIVDD
jgi:hypothetical protein